MNKCATSVAAIVVAFATMASAAETGVQSPQVQSEQLHKLRHVKISPAGEHIVHNPGNVVGNQATSKLAQSYTFTLENFRITDTRSVHNDTDFVSIAVAVGNKPAVTVPVKSMGDVNNGTYQVSLSIPNVSVAPGDKVAFSYAILNTGHDKDSVEKALKPVAQSAAQKAILNAVQAGGTYLGLDPATATAIGTAAGAWLGPKLADITFANCDGSVAAGDHAFMGSALAQQTSGGRFLSGTDDNKGTDSPTGCGANSRYYVTWSVRGATQNASTASGPGAQHGGDGRHHLQN